MINIDSKQSPYSADIDDLKMRSDVDPKMINAIENGDNDFVKLNKIRGIVVGAIVVVLALAWLFSL